MRLCWSRVSEVHLMCMSFIDEGWVVLVMAGWPPSIMSHNSRGWAGQVRELTPEARQVFTLAIICETKLE
jgi:hypothetical protein